MPRLWQTNFLKFQRPSGSDALIFAVFDKSRLVAEFGGFSISDAVFFGGMDAVAGPMIRQMKQLGINSKFMGGDGICSGELPKLAGGAMADGQVVCAEAGAAIPVAMMSAAPMAKWRVQMDMIFLPQNCAETSLTGLQPTASPICPEDASSGGAT